MKKLFSFLFVLLVTYNATTAQNSQTVTSYSAGTLSILVSSFSNSVTNLTITGTLDSRDFVIIRDAMPQLQVLDLSGVNIQAYYGTEGTYPWGYNSFPANELPMYAFYNPNGGSQTYNLKTIKLPDTLTSIGSNALNGCYNLTTLTIPSGVTSIGDNAFQSCNALTSISIPNTITTIGNGAFNYCQNIAGSITIPSSTISIGNTIFQGCSKVTKFIVDANNPNYSSLDSVLFNKNQTTIIECPEGKSGVFTIPNTVTTISDYAFLNCSKLTGSVVLPNSVTSIGSNSFNNCNSLTGTFTFGSGITTIGNSPFIGCNRITDFAIASGNANFAVSGGVLFNKNLTTLVKYPPGKTGSYIIPSSVTAIGNYAFYYCQNLTGDLVIPNTITIIGEGAFSSCNGLNGSLTIGSGVSTIGQSAFQSSNNIKVIYCLRATPPT